MRTGSQAWLLTLGESIKISPSVHSYLRMKNKDSRAEKHILIKFYIGKSYENFTDPFQSQRT